MLSNIYDLITMTDVLEHTQDPGKAILRVKSTSQARWFVLVTFPDIDSIEISVLPCPGRLYVGLDMDNLSHSWTHMGNLPTKPLHPCFPNGLEVIGYRRAYLRDESTVCCGFVITSTAHGLSVTRAQMEFSCER